MVPQRLHEGIGNGVLKGSKVDRDQFLAARRSQKRAELRAQKRRPVKRHAGTGRGLPLTVRSPSGS